jgi:hypothetical protein
MHATACSALLSTLTSLQDLQLQLTPMEGAGEGAGAFLDLLPCLHQLTALSLQKALVYEAPTPTPYASLLASSKLQRLQLTNARRPRGTWQQVLFPAAEEERSAAAQHASH